MKIKSTVVGPKKDGLRLLIIGISWLLENIKDVLLWFIHFSRSGRWKILKKMRRDYLLSV